MGDGGLDVPKYTQYRKLVRTTWFNAHHHLIPQARRKSKGATARLMDAAAACSSNDGGGNGNNGEVKQGSEEEQQPTKPLPLRDNIIRDAAECQLVPSERKGCSFL